jgi:predicted N-acetyltransferase YhbS
MTIRIANHDDVETLTAMVNRAFVVEEFFTIGDRTSVDRVRRLLEQTGMFLIAERNGVAVGCVFVKNQDGIGYFGMLSVEPAVAGRGVGRALVNAAERHLADLGCSAVEIEVVNLRTELLPFYERLGYVQTGERPFNTPGRAKLPCHFLVMSKSLESSPSVPPFALPDSHT